MESDKFIVVQEESSLNIIDLEKLEQSNLPKVQCDSAIMNPNTRVIGLRQKGNLQTYNLEMKLPMKKCQVDENVTFWTWISAKEIAFATEKSMFHWKMGDNSNPQKMFDLHENLVGAVIVSYKTDKSGQWLLLTGFKQINGVNTGVMQLFSVEKQVTQPIKGFAASFTTFKCKGKDCSLVCIANKQDNDVTLFIMELPSSVKTFEQKKVNLQFANDDFPISMETSERFGVVYVLSKNGFLHLLDVESGALLFQTRITDVAVFRTVPSNEGFVGINKNGRVMRVGVNDKTVVSCLISTGQNDLALRVASRANLSGSEDLYRQRLEQFLAQGLVQEAVQTIVQAPNQSLRTPDTLLRLSRMPVPQNTKPALSAYFAYVLETVGSLNANESVELGKIVLRKEGGAEYLKGLLDKGQLVESEALGDLLVPFGVQIALGIFFKAKAHDKVVTTLLSGGEWEKVLQYIEKVPEYTPNHAELFQKLVRASPDNAVLYAAQVYKKDKTLMDAGRVVDVFVQLQMIKQATAFLFSILKDDKEEDKDLQTKLLEINLKYSPVQVADSILGQNLFTHYDHELIARYCEKAQLFQRALENYTKLSDVKRVIVNTHMLSADFLAEFFGELEPQDGLACLYEILTANVRSNLKLAVRIAIQHTQSDRFKPEEVVKMFEYFKSYDGLYYFLFSLVDKTKDPELVFKFVEAAVRCGQVGDVERICKDNDIYDGRRMKEFLKENRSMLKTMMPLVYVCDKHDMLPELVQFLYANKLTSFLEAFVKQVNPTKTPVVISSLIDVDASDDYIRALLESVGSLCPLKPLVEAVEAKGNNANNSGAVLASPLKLIYAWLQARIKEGCKDPVAHNAVAKVKVDVNDSPEDFLKANELYDPRELGAYCERRKEPHLALVCFRRDLGKLVGLDIDEDENGMPKMGCDVELVDVTSRNGMWREQAVYLMARGSERLWRRVLEKDTSDRKLLIDQVVQSSLQDSHTADEISKTVQAFIVCNLPEPLLELLEQIVVKGKNSELTKNKNLQDLLIITAMKADVRKVMGYIRILSDFNPLKITDIAIKKGLFEEAFEVFVKFKMNDKALNVLVDKLESPERAEDFADQVNDPECFAILGRYQLHLEQSEKAIASFIKANSTVDYKDVIFTAAKTQHFKALAKFLQLARTHNHHDTMIDTELIYALAREAHANPTPANFADLEDLIASPQQGSVQDVGDRCFAEEMFEEARILFSAIPNYARLASALVRLKRLRDAVNAANNANSIKTWKEVLRACLDEKDFRNAQSCGEKIIIHADEIDEVMAVYEGLDLHEEAIKLLEKALGFPPEHCHKGIPTWLGVLYAKHSPKMLQEHLERYHRRCHIPKLLSVCEACQLWAELRFLLCVNNSVSEAITCMMDHPEAFSHSVMQDCCLKTVNSEAIYAVIRFYVEKHQEKLSELLTCLVAKLDHERVAREYMGKETLGMFKSYLESVQDRNLAAVNEAVNSLLIKEGDAKGLRHSIELYDKVDKAALGRALQTHSDVEFRRVAGFLFRSVGRFKEAIALAKQDKIYEDAMESAQKSNDADCVEDLLRFLVEQKLNEDFAKALTTCYSLVRPDVVLELAWKNQLTELVMPYFIRSVRDSSARIEKLEKALLEKEKSEKEKSEKGGVMTQQQNIQNIQNIQNSLQNAIPDFDIPIQNNIPQQIKPFDQSVFL